MNKFALITVLAFSATIFAGCDKEEPTNDDNFVGIEGISFENYPKVETRRATSLQQRRHKNKIEFLEIIY